MKKIQLGVIFGGQSGEHEVSLKSARSVLSALDQEKYEIVPIGIDRNGRWFVGQGGIDLLEGRKCSEQYVANFVAQLDGRYQLQVGGGQIPLDVVIPILHGSYGEDGTIQGLFEMMQIPYVGAGVVGSAVGMDKAIFKYVMMANQIPILPWVLVTDRVWQKEEGRIIDQLESELRYPMFTKPANLGSSVGINKCLNREQLIAGLEEAFGYDRRVVVEQGIEVRELEVAVLGNEHPEASVVGEIQPQRAFYDYVAKYMSDDSLLLIPAPLSEEDSERVRQLAIKAYQMIDGIGLGRVDLLMDKKDGRFYLNEINTMPGFTSISMYPKLWDASGLSYGKLLDRLIQLGLEQFKRKSGLNRTLNLKSGVV